MFKRTRIRLVLLNAVVFLFILNGFGAAIYGFMQKHLYSEIDDQLVAMGEHMEKENFRDVIARGPHGGDDPDAGSQTKPNPNADLNSNSVPQNNPNPSRPMGTFVWDANGNFQNLLSTEGGMVSQNMRKELKLLLDKENTLQTVTVDGQTYRILTLSTDAVVHVKTDDVKLGHVQLVADIQGQKDMLRSLLWVIGGGSLLSVAVAVAAGWFLANRALVPIQNAWNKQQQFVADASHELRTPLAVMQLHLERLFRHPEQTIEAASEDISAALQETKRVNKLVSDLLTLARSDSNELEILRQKLRLDQVLERVVQRFRQVALLKEVEIQMEISHPIEFNGDEERLQQLFVILLDNALKYTTEHGKIMVTCIRTGNQIQIGVRDTGVGIPANDLPYIFDRFFRGDKVRSRTAEGHGLGLSIAKWIVEAHQGKIRAESELGKGTVFWISLPV